jgi:hypothetical protein
MCDGPTGPGHSPHTTGIPTPAPRRAGAASRACSVAMELHDKLQDLEEDLEDDEHDDDPLEHVGVLRVQLVGEHVEELLDDVETFVEDLGAPINLKVLGGAQVEVEPLVVLPEELRVVEDVRVQIDRRSVDKSAQGSTWSPVSSARLSARKRRA